MSAESECRAELIASAPLLALVPAKRICVDAVPQDFARPYIAFSKQRTKLANGLDNSEHARCVVLDLQVVGTSRANAIAVREQLEDTLRNAGVPIEDNGSAYDPELDLEVEVITVDWWLTT